MEGRKEGVFASCMAEATTAKGRTGRRRLGMGVQVQAVTIVGICAPETVGERKYEKSIIHVGVLSQNLF